MEQENGPTVYTYPNNIASRRSRQPFSLMVLHKNLQQNLNECLMDDSSFSLGPLAAKGWAVLTS